MISEALDNNSSGWNLAQRISFRFFFLYFLLYIFPFPAYYIPGVSQLSAYFSTMMQSITMWFGMDVFGFTETIDPTSNGSGDRLYSYVSMYANLIMAVAGCLIWSLVDFRRRDYSKLLVYLTVYLRYYLATTLLSYGFSKVFTNQFSELGLTDLLKPYGESSPMGLMWNFMEFSDSYTIFSGISEVLAGTFLLWRRTMTLGALFTVIVMLTIFMINMSYDVPVKLYSGHLLLMGLFLLVLDGKRLLHFLIFNKAVVARKISPYFKKKWWRIGGVVFKYMFIIFIFGTHISNAYNGQREWGKKAPKPVLYGIYDVELFIKNNDTLLALKTDSTRWDKLVVDKYSTVVFYMDGHRDYFKNETDTLKQKLYLSSYREDSSKFYHDLSYTTMDSIFSLSGVNNKDSLHIRFIKKSPKDFLLINRGFHWVNDYPFNR